MNNQNRVASSALKTLDRNRLFAAVGDYWDCIRDIAWIEVNRIKSRDHTKHADWYRKSVTKMHRAIDIMRECGSSSPAYDNDISQETYNLFHLKLNK